jgi:DNA-binding IclR family transcriptional regulator
MTEQQRSGQGGVPSVARAARILTTISEVGGRGLTLSDIARRVEAPKTSALSICTTLVEVGFLVRDGDRYKLGLGAVKLARGYTANSDVPAEFWRANAELRPLASETIVLSVLDGANVVYVGCRKGERPVAMSYEIGLSLPAHCTASGKAMLARLPVAVIEGRYEGKMLPRLTDRSVPTLAELQRQLETIRAAGFAVDDEETARGMCCYGVALFDEAGRPVCALSVSLVKAAHEEAEVVSTLKGLWEFAARLSERLGLPQPEPLNGGVTAAPAVARAKP